jgi:hypothetical protein
MAPRLLTTMTRPHLHSEVPSSPCPTSSYPKKDALNASRTPFIRCVPPCPFLFPNFDRKDLFFSHGPCLPTSQMGGTTGTRGQGSHVSSEANAGPGAFSRAVSTEEWSERYRR